MADTCISDMQSCLKLDLLLKTVNSCSGDLYANTLPYTHPSLKSKLNKCSRLTMQEIIKQSLNNYKLTS